MGKLNGDRSSQFEVVFLFAQRRLTTMYRPQYLEQKYEVITVQNGNGEIVRKYRRPKERYI